MKKNRLIAGILFVLLCVFFSGCTAIGPGTVARDRFNYTDAISESWKRQMLLNLVKLRYGDAPVFLDVSAIINQYSLETQVNAGASWNAFLPTDSQTIGAAGRFSDRPTITYQPVVGDKFTRSLMTPIRPDSILSLIEAGYRADYVLRVCAQSINSLNNSTGGRLKPRHADPRFYQVVESIRKVQESMAVGMRVQRVENKATATVLLFRKDNIEPQVKEEILNTRKLLGLNQELEEFQVVYGSVARDETEIAILSRSMLAILGELGAYIKVPDDHVADQRVLETTMDKADAEAGVDPLIQVYSGINAPENEDAFVVVPYQGYYFWIDNKDYKSKKLFSFLMFLFTLAESGSPSQAPLLTIPTG